MLPSLVIGHKDVFLSLTMGSYFILRQCKLTRDDFIVSLFFSKKVCDTENLSKVL